MDRRTFIKNVAAGTLATSVMGVSKAHAMMPENAETSLSQFPNFKFKASGKFKVLQFTDTHYIAGNPKSPRALQNVREMLDTERPDLVIHTGDVIFGQPAEQSFREILAPLSERKIPFAIAFGNHDEECGISRKEALDLIRTLPYNINTPEKGITGMTNDVITLSSRDGKLQRLFYLFDSGNHVKTIKNYEGYDFIHFDQIAWYRKLSAEITKQNGGTPVPALAFMHIPVYEYNQAFSDYVNAKVYGTYREHPCSPSLNSGLFASALEMGDIKAFVSGHDHNNDYAMFWNRMFLIYGRYSGCDTVYNDLKPNGARVFEFTEGKEGFRSWIRLNGGQKTQDLRFPEDF